jgi:hypothetical protein
MAVQDGKQQEMLVNGERTKEYHQMLAQDIPGLPLNCLREVLPLFPRVRSAPPRACLLLGLTSLGCSAGARLHIAYNAVPA